MLRNPSGPLARPIWEFSRSGNGEMTQVTGSGRTRPASCSQNGKVPDDSHSGMYSTTSARGLDRLRITSMRDHNHTPWYGLLSGNICCDGADMTVPAAQYSRSQLSINRARLRAKLRLSSITSAASEFARRPARPATGRNPGWDTRGPGPCERVGRAAFPRPAHHSYAVGNSSQGAPFLHVVQRAIISLIDATSWLSSGWRPVASSPAALSTLW